MTLLNGNWRLLRNAITLISPDLLLLPTPIDISTLYDYVWAIPYGSEVLQIYEKQIIMELSFQVLV